MALHSIAQRSLVLFSWEEARGVARDLVGGSGGFGSGVRSHWGCCEVASLEIDDVLCSKLYSASQIWE